MVFCMAACKIAESCRSLQVQTFILALVNKFSQSSENSCAEDDLKLGDGTRQGLAAKKSFTAILFFLIWPYARREVARKFRNLWSENDAECESLSPTSCQISDRIKHSSVTAIVASFLLQEKKQHPRHLQEWLLFVFLHLLGKSGVQNPLPNKVF